MAEAATLSRQKASVFGPPMIDCDMHIAVPSIAAIMPYLDRYWRQQFLARGIDKISWNLTADPPNAPISGRPDWRPAQGKPGTDLALMRKALDDFGTTRAIAKCIWGGAALHSEDMAAVVCAAVNDWIVEHWLEKEPRLRASIVVPLGNPELAAAEIERRAGDKRFVQVTMFVAGEIPLGKRHHWPIYAAAEKHGLPVGVHAGSLYHHPMMANGYGSYFLEDYVAQAFAFESATLSLIAEGVFAKFPDLKVVFQESGVTWLPACLWRFSKTWRGVRAEIPWVKKSPRDVARDNIRLTTQPLDEPEGARRIERFCEMLDSDRMLLFSSDFPHWHYEGVDALPLDATSPLARRVLFDNALDTYPRLREA